MSGRLFRLHTNGWPLLLLAIPCLIAVQVADGQVPADLESKIQPRMVKIFGSGGYANLHAYQTGFFISKSGKVLTVWSHVLDGKNHCC